MTVAVDQPNYIPWKGYFDLNEAISPGQSPRMPLRYPRALPRGDGFIS